MEHGAKVRVKEELYVEIIIKTEVDEMAPSTTQVDSKFDINYLNQEPGLTQHAENKTLLVEKEIAKGSTQGGDEQQGVPVEFIHTTVSNKNALADSADQSKQLYIKEELDDTDLNMDSHYGTNQMHLIDSKRANPTTNIDPEEVLSRTDDHQVVLSQVRDKTIKSCKDIGYKCDKCIRTFKSKETLKKHHQRMHGTESHRCIECNKEFKCRAYLLIHLNYVHSNQQCECLVCKKVFKSKRALGDHLLRVRGHKPASSHSYIYTCDYCQKTFWRKPSLRQHILCVHGERVHRCHKCNKTFKFRNHLRRHNTRTHGKPQLECEKCHQFFTQRSLNAHIKKAHSSKGIPSKSGLRSQKVRVSFPEKPRPVGGEMSAVVDTSTQQDSAVTVKTEPADVKFELGPVVLQHKDLNIQRYKEEPLGD